MRRHYIALIMLAALSVISPNAWPQAAPPPARNFLPDRFADWAVAASGTTGDFDPAYIGPIARENGFLRGELRTYTRGNESLQVTLLVMKDPTGAYGLYSFLRSNDLGHGSLEASSIADHAVMSNSWEAALLGNLIVEITDKSLAKHQTDLQSLVDKVSPFGERDPYPSLHQHLPTANFEAFSDRYLLGSNALGHEFSGPDGDWLGFSLGAEAELARYRVNGQELTLLLADFPTPQAASKKLEDYGKLFNLNGASAGDSRPAVYATRSLTLVAIVSGARSEKLAAVLLNKIHSGTELTWNEPGFSLADANLNSVIASIIVGTGILCMFTLVAGLAFGGVRLVVKRILPGRVFDRGTAMDVLQLGLASKPINSDDFYGMSKSGPPLPASRET